VFLPLTEFCELEVGLGPDDVLPHCAKCREHGVQRPKFLNLTRRHHVAMAAMMSAPTLSQGYTDAAEATGFSRGYIKHLASGRRVPEFRRLYQLKLEMAGGDMNRIIQVQVEALAADEHKWNPAEEDFSHFADHRTRLRAAQHIQQTLELNPPKADGINVAVGIKFETNLGTGKTFDPPNVMRATPIVDVSHE
jgi:hypothetical protein